MHQVVRLGMLFAEKHYGTLYIVHSLPSQNISMHTATIYFLQPSVICLATVIFHVNCMHTSTSLTLMSFARSPSLGTGAEKSAKGGLLAC